MSPETLKLIPLLCVFAASYFLWSNSQSRLKRFEEEPRAKLGRIVKLTDYMPPTSLQDPFVFSSGHNPIPKGSSKTSAVKKEESVIRVDGIMWNGSNPLASVNGRLVSQGEQIGGLRVVKILPDQVIFKQGAKTVVHRVAPK